MDKSEVALEQLHNCRVCGLWSEDAPWGETGNDPTFVFCDCCGAEAGYQDSSCEAAKNHRAKWLAQGSPWHVEERKPAGWDIHAQLSQIPTKFAEPVVVTLHSTVRLLNGIARSDIPSGSLAVVLEIHTEPSLAYEIEVVSENGDTLYLGAVSPEDIELVDPNRPLPSPE